METSSGLNPILTNDIKPYEVLSGAHCPTRDFRWRITDSPPMIFTTYLVLRTYYYSV